MATDAGPSEDLLAREAEEEELRRKREAPVAGPAPLREDEAVGTAIAGPASPIPASRKGRGVVRTPEGPDYGGLQWAPVTFPATLLGASGLSTLTNRASHALAAEQASEDYYQQYIKDPHRLELIEDLRTVKGWTDSQIAEVIEKERRWLDSMRVSRTDEARRAHYPPKHIEEGENDDPYVREHLAFRLTPDIFRTAVNEGVENNPLVQANPDYFADIERMERGSGLRVGADRFASLQRDYLYSTKSSPMIKAWIDWNETIDVLEKDDPEWVEALVHSSKELGIGLIDLVGHSLGMGQIPPGYTRAEFASELGETLSPFGGLAGFAGAVTGNFSRSLRYNPSPLLVFLIPAALKVAKGVAKPSTKFMFEQAMKIPALSEVLTPVMDRAYKGMKIELPQLVREPGKVDKGKTEFSPDPMSVRPGEFRPQKLGEALPEALRDVGMAMLLGVPGTGLTLMATRAAHRGLLKNPKYREWFNEKIKEVQRNRQAEDLETTERMGETQEGIGRAPRVAQSLGVLGGEEAALAASRRTEALPSMPTIAQQAGQDVSAATTGRRPKTRQTGQAHVGERTAELARKETDDPSPPPKKEGVDQAVQAEAPVVPPEPPAKKPEARVPKQAVDTPTAYEVPLGDNLFIQVVTPEDAAVARRGMNDQILLQATRARSRAVDHQAKLDKRRSRSKEHWASIERERFRRQKELELLSRDREPKLSSEKKPVRELEEKYRLDAEAEALAPDGIIGRTLSNLKERFDPRSVDKAFAAATMEIGPNKRPVYGATGGITMTGKLIEGSPLESLVRKGGGSAHARAQWVARDKSKVQIERQEQWKSGQEALGETAPEVVTQWDVSKVEYNPDGTPKKTKQGRMSARTEEGAVPVGEKQVFTRTGGPQSSKAYHETLKRREDSVKKIMEEEKLGRAAAEELYNIDLKAQEALAKKKADRTPDEVAVDRHNARIDALFESIRKAFSLPDKIIPKDILYRRSGKGATLPITKKLIDRAAEEGKPAPTKGNKVYPTQLGFVGPLKSIVSDIARDRNLSMEQRRMLLERLQKSEADSLFPPKQKVISDADLFRTARAEVESYKRGEIPIQLEGLSRPTQKKFVESEAGLRSVIGRRDKDGVLLSGLKKKLADKKITLDEYTAALHEHLYQLVEDVKGIASIDSQTLRSVQLVLSELRGRVTSDQKVRGPAPEVNIYNTRVGRWAIERLSRMTEAEIQRKGDVTHIGEKGTLATELRPIFNFLRQEIRNAEDMAASRPGTRYHDHLAIARDHHRGVSVTGKATARFIEFLDRLKKTYKSNRLINIRNLRKSIHDAALTRPEKYALERIVAAMEHVQERRSGTLRKAGMLRPMDLIEIMKKHDERPKAHKKVVAEVGKEKGKVVEEGPPKPVDALPKDVNARFSKRFVAKYREVTAQILRIDKKQAVPAIRAVYEALQEIFTHGESLVLSDSFKRVMANKMAEVLGKDMTPENIDALHSSIFDFFGFYDSPMSPAKISDKWASAPGAFHLLDAQGKPMTPYVLNRLIETTFEGLSKKEQQGVVREAVTRLMERVSEYAADKSMDIVTQADRRRWGYEPTVDTALSAAIKMAKAVILYADANPLFPPNIVMKVDPVLSKKMGVEVSRPTRIESTAFGKALRSNKQKIIDDFNLVMKEKHGREMTKKEVEHLFGKDKEGISPESKMGRFIKNLDDLKPFHDEGRSPLMDLLEVSLSAGDKEKEKKKKKGDEFLPDDYPRSGFDSFIDRNWFEDIGWELDYRKSLTQLGPQVAMFLKQKVTSESTLTNIGNTVSNLTAIALTTGEIMPAVIARIVKTTLSYMEFRKDPKAFLEKNGELGEAFMAIGDTGILTTNYADVELGSRVDLKRMHKLNNMEWSSHGNIARLRDMAIDGIGSGIIAGPAYGLGFAILSGLIGPKIKGKVREFRRWLYSWEDNAPKMAEFTRHYVDVKRWLNRHEVGDVATIQTTRNARVHLKRTEAGWSIGTGARWARSRRNVTPKELRKIIASYSARRTYGRVFNYADAPRILKEWRNRNLIGPMSHFVSYPYFAIDMPGKRGLVSGTILDNVLDSGLKSSNAVLNIELASQAFAQGMRKTMMAGQILQQTHPFQHDLDRLAAFGAESAFNSSAIILDTANENTVATVRTVNADGYKKSRDGALIVLALAAQQRGEPPKGPPPKKSRSYIGMKWDQYNQIVDENAAYFRNKIDTGETLKTKDWVALFEGTGTQMFTLIGDIHREGAAVKKHGVSVWDRVALQLSGAIMGVDSANIRKVLRGLGHPAIEKLGIDAQPPDPDHPYSAFRYPIKTQRFLNPNMTKAEEVRFMIDTAVGTALNVLPREKIILEGGKSNPFLKAVSRSLKDGAYAMAKAERARPGITGARKLELDEQLKKMDKEIDLVMEQKVQAFRAIIEHNRIAIHADRPSQRALKAQRDLVRGRGRRISQRKQAAALRQLREEKRKAK